MAGEVPDWLKRLDEEDYPFIRRFVLASGSLKALAEEYGVSYPTLRQRLNRLIDKIQRMDDPRTRDPFYRKLQSLVSDGVLTPRMATSLYKLARRSQGET
jgi:hypothetical protein